MPRQSLDQLDLNILRNLSANARKPYLEIARECGVSGAAIHQRIQRLTQIGVIRGSESLIDPIAVGYDTCAYVGLCLRDPAQYNSVVAALMEIPEIVECHFTTGPYTMLVKLYARDNEQLMDLLNNQMQGIPGVVATETLISLEQSIKREIAVIVDK